jgi:hypothetical protein
MLDEKGRMRPDAHWILSARPDAGLALESESPANPGRKLLLDTFWGSHVVY